MSYFNIIRQRKTRQGFTLVELLVVIVIIGILGSLVFVGGQAAIRAARQGVIKSEISQVGLALESYTSKHGEYPPDFSDEAAVLRHVRKRWPSYKFTNFSALCADIQAGSLFQDENGKWYAWDFENTDVSHMAALAFWLGGLPEPATGMLGGFAADVSAPMSVGLPGDGTQRETPLMELTIGANCKMYQVVNASGNALGTGTKADPYLVLPAIVARELPFVYFKASAKGDYLQKDSVTDPKHIHFDMCAELQEAGCAAPYAKTNAAPDEAVWHNPKGYQLVHPGLDGNFGGGGHPDFRVIDPSKDVRVGCSLADNDNQANFGGTTIEAGGN